MDNNNLQDDCQSVRVGRIYFIRCLITNMYYVGQTVRKLNERIGQHRRCKTSEIGKAIHKYGWKNFTHGILEDNVPVELLNEREKYWIAFFDCVIPKGYNRTHGGQVRVVYSNAAREKMRKSHLGEKNSMFGKSHDESTKKKISEAMKGEKNPMFGRTGADNPMYGRSGITSPMFGRKGAASPRFGKNLTEELRKKLVESHRERSEILLNKTKEQIIILMLAIGELES